MVQVKKHNRHVKKKDVDENGNPMPRVVKRVFYCNDDMTVFAVGKAKGRGTKKIFPVGEMMVRVQNKLTHMHYLPARCSYVLRTCIAPAIDFAGCHSRR